MGIVWGIPTRIWFFMGRPMDPAFTRPLQATFVLPILERSKIMLRCIKRTTVRLWSDESGASLLEYSVLVGLITVGVVGSVLAVSAWTGARWTTLIGTLATSPS